MLLILWCRVLEIQGRTVNYVINKGSKIGIPKSLHPEIIRQIHAEHFRIEKYKMTM